MSHLPNGISKQQQLLMLYASMAQVAFTEIRNLAFGRTSLHQNTPEFPESVPTETLLQNLFVAGQLAEAMHNLPITLDNDFEQYLTWKNMCRFVEKNPQYHRIFQSKLDIIFKLNHQVISEIDADYFRNKR